MTFAFDNKATEIRQAGREFSKACNELSLDLVRLDANKSLIELVELRKKLLAEDSFTIPVTDSPDGPHLKITRQGHNHIYTHFLENGESDVDTDDIMRFFDTGLALHFEPNKDPDIGAVKRFEERIREEFEAVAEETHTRALEISKKSAES